MAIVEPKPDDIIFGLEIGPDTSVVATGLRKDVEQCVNVGALSTHFHKHDFPSTVAFSGKIRLYGEEAECRVNYEPKDTLVCLPMWMAVRTAADGQEVERRLTNAPLVEVTIYKGNITFHVDVDHKKIAIPLPVVLGDFIRFLRYMALVLNPQFTKRVGHFKGAQLRYHLQHDKELVRHVGVVVVPAFLTVKDVRVVTAALAVTGVPMQILNRTSAVVNWWCCDKLPREYDVLKKLQHTNSTKEGGNVEGGEGGGGGGGKGKGEQDEEETIRIGILDIGAADSSFVILELTPGDKKNPSVSQEHLMRQPQQKVAVKVLCGETAANMGFADIVRLVADSVRQYVKEHFHVEIREHTERYWKLSLACGRCVRTLCDVEESVVDMDDFVVKKTHLRMECSRKHLESICASLIEPYRKFLVNTLTRAGLSVDKDTVSGSRTAATSTSTTATIITKRKSPPLTAVYAVGTLVRVPWMLQVTEEVLGVGEYHFPLPDEGSEQQQMQHTQQQSSSKQLSQGRLQFITEEGGQVAAYGAAYFAAGQSYIRCMVDEGSPYSEAELLDMTSLEEQLTQIEHREIVRRETYAKVHSYVLEMRQASLSLFPTSLKDPDRTAKVLRDAEAALTSLRDASEEQLKKVLHEFRGYFEGHEPAVFQKVEDVRLQRIEEEKKAVIFDAKRAMDLVIRHVGEEKDAQLPPDACVERAKRDLEEAKRLIESGQYDLGIFTADKSLEFVSRISEKDVSDTQTKDKLSEIRLEAPLQLAKAQTLKADHDRAIQQRPALLQSAISHCTNALKLE